LEHGNGTFQFKGQVSIDSKSARQAAMIGILQPDPCLATDASVVNW
jgi:hypothetical protein